MPTRRETIRAMALWSTALTIPRGGRAALQERPSFLTPESDVKERAEKARPSLGGKLPANFKARLGSTHVDGQYFRTTEPFLIEGAKALHNFGFGIAKFWFTLGVRGYAHNSTWEKEKLTSLEALAKHPYYKAAFALPFSTIFLEVEERTAKRGPKGELFHSAALYDQDEQEIYDLTRYLLTTYRNRDITFVLQNWEGDWLMRGSFGEWNPGETEDTKERCTGFTRWIAARQRGVDRARKNIGTTKCRVLHAVEVNRVLDAWRGVPTITTHVLPQVGVDLISWSCYDGLSSPVNLWHGLETLEHYRKTRPDGSKPPVYIGEIGLPESGLEEKPTIEAWDAWMGVLLAKQIPYILHWELYCNEPKDKKPDSKPVRTAEELRGFWLIRPDGSLGYAAKYFKSLLAKQ